MAPLSQSLETELGSPLQVLEQTTLEEPAKPAQSLLHEEASNHRAAHIV